MQYISPHDPWHILAHHFVLTESLEFRGQEKLTNIIINSEDKSISSMSRNVMASPNSFDGPEVI